MVHILVADDDVVVADVVRRYLQRDGMDVTVVDTGSKALEKVGDGTVDLAILDVMMPEGDGISVCEQIRRGVHAELPIIMLTALGEEEDRVAGLESGADDYVAKPFSPRELSLRVQSVLRRATAAHPVHHTEIRDGNIRVDPASCAVTVDGREISTTKREFDLLMYFLGHPGVVFTREELLDHVWGWTFGDISTVTVHVKRLRAKLGTAARIETVWGRGYRWNTAGDGPGADTA
ncbi:response regulator transcription factor [Gordonia sp. OPL2]|uniref:response regulator transcription factor n=1 Tax=Gordonia sp. OPL2 TaxID=2486274 RepID=UPI0016558112|nr:response regulator transcription factor [Gordonia sp. OPL2]ROZ98343.1 DNA-binding response regulator [Gordonia sp. OPL2]